MVDLAGTHHFNFTVADMERSIAFYRDVLGLKLVTDWTSDDEYLGRITGFQGVRLRLAFFELPGTPTQLELIQYLRPTAPAAEIRRNVPGAGHLCFDVPDIHAAYRELSGQGVRFTSEPVEILSVANRGAWGVYLLDPDGITIELRQPPQPRG